jgi:hypothetical protein
VAVLIVEDPKHWLSDDTEFAAGYCDDNFVRVLSQIDEDTPGFETQRNKARKSC